MAGAAADFRRVYTNPGRGVSVSVLLLGGLPGKISTHTPDVCYTGAGFTLNSRRPMTSTTAAMDSGGPNSRPPWQREGERIPLSCGSSGAGTPPRGGPRPPSRDWHSASAPALCKLYVIRETAGAAVEPGADPCNDFLSVFLPELDRLVFSNPK